MEKEIKKYVVSGTVTLDVSMEVESVDQEALQRAFEILNDLNVLVGQNVSLEKEDGEMVHMKTNAIDFDWEHSEEIKEDKEKATKQ